MYIVYVKYKIIITINILPWNKQFFPSVRRHSKLSGTNTGPRKGSDFNVYGKAKGSAGKGINWNPPVWALRAQLYI